MREYLSAIAWTVIACFIAGLAYAINDWGAWFLAYLCVGCACFEWGIALAPEDGDSQEEISNG